MITEQQSPGAAYAGATGSNTRRHSSLDRTELPALAALFRHAEARAFARRCGPELFSAGVVRDMARAVMAGRQYGHSDPSGDAHTLAHQEAELIDWLTDPRPEWGLVDTPSRGVRAVERLAARKAVPILVATCRWAALSLDRGAPPAYVFEQLHKAFSLPPVGVGVGHG